VSIAVVKTLIVWAVNDDKLIDLNQFHAYFLSLLQSAANSPVKTELFKLLNILSSANRLADMAPIIREVDKQFAALFVDSSNSAQIVEVLKLLASSNIGLGKLI